MNIPGSSLSETTRKTPTKNFVGVSVVLLDNFIL